MSELLILDKDEIESPEVKNDTLLTAKDLGKITVLEALAVTIESEVKPPPSWPSVWTNRDDK